MHTILKDNKALNNLHEQWSRMHEINASINALTEIQSWENILIDFNNLQETGSLYGWGIVVKDNICTKQLSTTCASKALKGFQAQYNATVVERLFNQGAILLGKSNMDEFGMGSSNLYSAYGPTYNNLDKNYIAGGSSGGSAAAVSAKMCRIALGSDTGGSVRLPAMFHGLYGIKPTYGAFSRYGLVAFSSSLDQIGVISNNIEDLAYACQIMSGADEKDPTTLSIDPKIFTNELTKEPQLVNVGVDYDLLYAAHPDLHNLINLTLQKIQDKGHKLISIKLPVCEKLAACYMSIVCSESYTNLARFDGIRFGAQIPESGSEVQARLACGKYAIKNGLYTQAASYRTMIINQIRSIYHSNVDVILTNVSLDTARCLNEDSSSKLANLCGLPAVNFPIGYHENLPFGLQLIGKQYQDGNLLHIIKNLDL